ncbi:MAG: argininosuccinate lyase [Anaerolineales bacterium]|nr:argininosuccinate lyase [Anaerolineales bacterium]
MTQLWTGRFQESLDPKAAALNDSLSFDRRLSAQDVRGSTAWAHALRRAGVLTEEEAGRIEEGLKQIGRELAEGAFAFAPSDEDIHTAVERRLGELIGAAAGKLHTGRSRNDQVAADFRMWIVEAESRILGGVRALQEALLARAQADFGAVLPGYTHTQRAQPILLSHWWLSHFWALDRDRLRLREIRERAAVCPLGSGALAGTAFPVDRDALAAELGFKSASPNSIDAVADRDFAAEFLFAAAMLGVHVSRMADALILFSTAEFGFVELDDAYATGSSLMPQKKNPDLLELARGKSGKLIGLLTGLLAVLKGLPSAYDKDLQEDKPAAFEAADTLEAVLPALRGVLETLTVHRERMAAALDDGMFATDLADYLVRRGVPFRQAHTAAGRAVRRAIELGIPLSRLEMAELRKIHPAVGQDLAQVFCTESALSHRSAKGGTAPSAVKEQIDRAVQILQEK